MVCYKMCALASDPGWLHHWLNVMKYSQTLIDDEYESDNIYSERISGNNHLNHTYLAATK